MSSDDSDEKIALLNEIRDEVRGLGDDTHKELVGLREDIHGLLGTVNRVADRIEGGLDRMDRGVDRIEGRVDRIEGQVDRMDGQFDRIDAALADCAEQARLTVHYTKVLCQQWGIEIEPE